MRVLGFWGFEFGDWLKVGTVDGLPPKVCKYVCLKHRGLRL